MAEAEEIQLLKSALCMKDHELYALRSEIERHSSDMQMLALSIERLEKTMAASYDRLIHRLDPDSRKRRRR